jgi:hypothetical protein
MKRLIVLLFLVATAAVVVSSGQNLLQYHRSQTLAPQNGSAVPVLLADGTAPPVPDVPLNLQKSSDTNILADGTAPPVPDVPLSLQRSSDAVILLADGTAPPVPDVPLS